MHLHIKKVTTVIKERVMKQGVIQEELEGKEGQGWCRCNAHVKSCQNIKAIIEKMHYSDK